MQIFLPSNCPIFSENVVGFAIEQSRRMDGEGNAVAYSSRRIDMLLYQVAEGRVAFEPLVFLLFFESLIPVILELLKSRMMED